MILADGGITVVWIGVLLIIGFLGFFAVLLAAILRLFGKIIGGIGWLLRGGRSRTPPPLERPRVCTNPRCGHVNVADGRYCARCGAPLRTLSEA